MSSSVPDDFDGPDFGRWLADVKSSHSLAARTVVDTTMDDWSMRIRGMADGTFTLAVGRRAMEVLAAEVGVNPIPACEYPLCDEPQYRGLGLHPPTMVRLCRDHFDLARKRTREGRQDDESDPFYVWYLSMTGVLG